MRPRMKKLDTKPIFEVLEDWMVEAYINLKPKVLESVQILIINRAVVVSAQGSRPNSIAVFLILVLVCGGDRKDKQLRPLYSCGLNPVCNSPQKKEDTKVILSTHITSK